MRSFVSFIFRLLGFNFYSPVDPTLYPKISPFILKSINNRRVSEKYDIYETSNVAKNKSIQSEFQNWNICENIICFVKYYIKQNVYSYFMFSVIMTFIFTLCLHFLILFAVEKYSLILFTPTMQIGDLPFDEIPRCDLFGNKISIFFLCCFLKSSVLLPKIIVGSTALHRFAAEYTCFNDDV